MRHRLCSIWWCCRNLVRQRTTFRPVSALASASECSENDRFFHADCPRHPVRLPVSSRLVYHSRALQSLDRDSVQPRAELKEKNPDVKKVSSDLFYSLRCHSNRL